MILLLLLLSICMAPLYGADLGNPVVVDAQFGYYDGQSIFLQGDVVLEHDLGTVSADEATLSRTAVDDETQFSLLNLSGTIHMLLGSGGSFHCSKAEIDFATLTGHFYGDEHCHSVSYTDTINEEGKSVVLRGEKMTVVMNQLEVKGEKGPLTHQVQEILADDHVTVDYNHEFMAAGDHLLYERFSTVQENAKETMPGIIYLRPNQFYGTCQVTSCNGDLIIAQEIAMNLPSQKIDFLEPRGAIHFFGSDDRRKRLDFSAQFLSWDNFLNLLTLENKVVLYQDEMGNLTGDHVQVCQHPGGGLQKLEWIRAIGTTKITYDDVFRADHHKLMCYGEVYIDAKERVTTLKSPIENGLVPAGKQMFFKDKRGSVFADSARIDYQLEDSSVTPKKLTLMNRVKLVNRTVDGQATGGKPLQYALADVLEYLPEEQQMHLYALEEKRVLVYDRLNNVQVSAPAVNVRRDGSTGKEAIEGVGDVRFSFAEGERAHLLEEFASEESSE